MIETVNHPEHYRHPTSGLECCQLSAYMPHPLASALEYVWRYEGKNGVEDLKKARWWLQFWLDVGDIPRIKFSGLFAGMVSRVVDDDPNEARAALIYDICAASDVSMTNKRCAKKSIKSAISLLDILIEDAA